MRAAHRVVFLDHIRALAIPGVVLFPAIDAFFRSAGIAWRLRHDFTARSLRRRS